jgi:leucyl-tRNA synthetase
VLDVAYSLLNQLEQLKRKKEGQKYAVAEVFARMAPALAVYTPYCANHPQALSLLESLRQHHSAFTAFEKVHNTLNPNL